ncbi:MAG: hypothetical protein FWD09_05225 [Lentimicrobiaceae bacterium]|nr:hypothetical protein [Lentimicrobiaceae bacterium]
MVFYNKSALDDIEQIFIGLLEWQTKDNQQLRMTYDEVWNYRDSLFHIGNTLDILPYHAKAQYEMHKQFGKYAYRYNKNQRTQWYFIYDRIGEDIFINKIINNYMTIL